MKRQPPRHAALPDPGTYDESSPDAGAGRRASPRGAAARTRALAAMRSVSPAIAGEIQAAAAAGASPRDLAQRFGVAGPLVAWVLRSPTARVLLPSPYGDAGRLGADVAYWLGVIAVRGRLHGAPPHPALVVDIPADGEACVGLLVRALVREHVHLEFCYSSLHGLQAYVRDPELCRILADWGLEGPGRLHERLAFDSIPSQARPAFLRGMLEGGYWGRSSPLPRRNGAPGRLGLRGPVTLVRQVAAYLKRRTSTGAAVGRTVGRQAIWLTRAGEAALLAGLYPRGIVTPRPVGQGNRAARRGSADASATPRNA